ncbi:MAG: hypothetical protein GQ530_04450 [Desulfuromonadales bacterium]|nr:hypothetical protein [Desulfuromonadales bacterium]
MKYRIYIFLVCLYITGCIPAPHKETNTPEIYGVVLDAETKASIEGVSVSLVPGDTFGVALTLNINYMDVTDVQFTDSSGAFNFSSTSSWLLYYYPSSKFGAIHEFLLKFNHPDYNEYTYAWEAPFASWQKHPPLRLDNIELERKTNLPKDNNADE